MMLRVWPLCLCALLALAAAGLVSGSVDVGSDEWSFAELTDAPLPSSAERAAAKSFYTDFTSKGKPSQGGGEEWRVETNSIVTNMWGGLVIGNVAQGTHLMIERYIYHKDAHEEATYGWGFVIEGSDETPFGGWYDSAINGVHQATSCGWFPLQRNFNGHSTNRAVKVRAHAQHKLRCLPYSNNTGQLQLKAIQHKRGMVDGHDGLGVVKRMRVKVGHPCYLYLNFDKKEQTFSGVPVATIAPGALLGRRYVVEGLTAKAAVVQTMNDVDTRGWQGWFFTQNECLEDI